MKLKCLALFVAVVLPLSNALCLEQTPADKAQQIAEHQQKIKEFLESKQPSRAIPEFQALVALEPDNVDAQANLGVLLYFQNRFAPAAEHLRAALQGEPDLGKIRGLLGLSEFQLGQDELALSDLKTALPQLEDRAFRKKVGLTLIQMDTATANLSEAANVAQQLRVKDPADPEILFACYRTATDLAGDSLLALSLTAPNSGQMQQAIAHELLRVRDNAGAIMSFRRAIAADPNLPGIHFELAEALRASPNTANRAEAEKEFRLAIEHNPQDVQAEIQLADMLADNGSLQEAATHYENALRVNPSNADAAVGLARVDSETGADEKALLLLQQAITEDPSNMLAHFRLGNLYRKLHRMEDSHRELAEYQKLKDLKEELGKVYSTMKLRTPGAEAPPASQPGMSH